MKAKNRFLAVFLTLCMVLSLVSVTAFAKENVAEDDKVIKNVSVDVNLNYNVGDKPDAGRASIPKDAHYKIHSQTILIRKDGNANLRWASDDPDTVSSFTFEDTTYEYQIWLEANDREGYRFPDDKTEITATLNGEVQKISPSHSSTITLVAQITPGKATTPAPDDKVQELSSAGATEGTIQFADGINKDYTLVIKPDELSSALTANNVKFLMDISVCDGDDVVPISDKEMTIKVKLPNELLGYDNYKVVYIQNNAIKETISATVADGYLTFKTTHLSQYGVIATNAEPMLSSDLNLPVNILPRTGGDYALVDGVTGKVHLENGVTGIPGDPQNGQGILIDEYYPSHPKDDSEKEYYGTLSNGYDFLTEFGVYMPMTTMKDADGNDVTTGTGIKANVTIPVPDGYTGEGVIARKPSGAGAIEDIVVNSDNTVTISGIDLQYTGSYLMGDSVIVEWKKAAASTNPGGTTPGGDNNQGGNTNQSGNTNQGGNTNSGTTQSPQTGDNSNLALWFALLLLSGCGVIATAVVSRKRKYNR